MELPTSRLEDRLRWSASDYSLPKVLDVTRTAMGGRLLRRWVGQPLLDRAALLCRHDAVEWFTKHAAARTKLAALLNQVADLERLCNRVRAGIASPRGRGCAAAQPGTGA